MESAEVFRRRLMESAEVFRRWLIILLVRHQSVESCIVNLKSITLHRLTLLTLSIITVYVLEIIYIVHSVIHVEHWRIN